VEEDNDLPVVEAFVLDDSYWREINIQADPSTVCSYRLLNSNRGMEKNTFELQISGMENVQIGLYYNDKDDQTDDMKLFSAEQCQEGVPHCTAGDGFV
jgi:hypothetical protein